jgi:hypothetical protein
MYRATQEEWTDALREKRRWALQTGSLGVDPAMKGGQIDA